MSRLLIALGAALVLAGCASGNVDPQGFTVDAPAGWEERTEEAERQRDSEYEVVYEKPGPGGVPTAINVQRSEAPEDVSVQREAERVREKVLDELGGRASPARLDKLGDDVALLFDHQAGDVRSRRIVAARGSHLYVITLQAPAARISDALEGLEAFQRSWRWAG